MRTLRRNRKLNRFIDATFVLIVAIVVISAVIYAGHFLSQLEFGIGRYQ